MMRFLNLASRIVVSVGVLLSAGGLQLHPAVALGSDCASLASLSLPLAFASTTISGSDDTTVSAAEGRVETSGFLDLSPERIELPVGSLTTVITNTIFLPFVAKAGIPTGQHPYTGTGSLNYLLYIPPDYMTPPQRGWPLVLYLHGLGERGNDPNKVAAGGLPKLVKQGQNYPFLLLSPQCPADKFWEDLYPDVEKLLNNVTAAYSVDSRRIYLTGVSMGSFGAVGLAQRHPERFAALVPIAGGYTWDPNIPATGYYTLDPNAPIPDQICVLKDTPAWLFHGAQDTVIPYLLSQHIAEKLQSCGGSPLFTLYPDAGHVQSWELAYADSALYNWLMSQSRP